MAPPKNPPDYQQREAIVRNLDRTMLVEAAAGTGKTTMLIRRMIALLAAGKCSIDTLAAVTFTRKAAADIRARFQIGLEREIEQQTAICRERLEQALENIERCFIGTIHSFCGRLLRERPVESGVDLEFVEIDEDTDYRLRRQAWHEYVESLFANDEKILSDLEEVGLQLVASTKRNDPLLATLEELGLELIQLGPSFLQLAEFPDVDEWPAPAVSLPDLSEIIEQLQSYIEHMERLIETFPDIQTNDKLMPLYRQVVRMARIVDFNRTAEVMEVLERFREGPTIVQKDWPLKAEQAKAERQRWNEFARDYAQPALTSWREHRYEVVMRAIRPAVDVYNRLRREANALNFQDLLLKSAALLRDKPQVRNYFRMRFTHLLVDEFQDTDPIQAEVMLLLTADDPQEEDWRRCRPVNGSLFVVGDPKQSIYRFRRADIVTYRKVKQIIQQHGGEIVALTANFRSTKSHIDWLNPVFGTVFPEQETDQSPARCDLLVGLEQDAASSSELAGIGRITIPAHLKKREVIDFEARVIASTIRRALDEGWTVPRQSPDEDPRVRPADFLIVTRYKGQLSTYGEHLQKVGVSHQVTGGKFVNQNKELALLYRCLRVLAKPDDALALLAILRSELFGISDPALYAFRRAGGRFNLYAPMPNEFPSDEAEAISDALQKLQQCANWVKQLPLFAAVEKIAVDLGLVIRGSAAPNGSARAGALMKSLEVLRSRRPEVWSTGSVVELIESLLDNDETHDALPLRPDRQGPVRIMNIHKAKGLEAAIVFLADPTGDVNHSVTMHIDRAGDRTRGYLAIYGQRKGWGDPPLLAHPKDWHIFDQREQDFLRAEDDRLLYVAATRAGSQLVITDYRKDSNPWSFFEQHMQENCTEIRDIPIAVQPRAEASITLRDAQIAREAISERWQCALRPTYEIVAAKSYALPTTAKPQGTGERAADWGTVIHRLLETATKRPGADLERLAFSLLDEYGLDTTLVPEAIGTVQTVRGSAIWQRAQSSKKCLAEIAFASLLDAGTDPCPVPTMLRGVIDLAFLEQDGWVIIDYKTEQIPAHQIQQLGEYYRGQVEIYARYWEKMTSECVHEAGLFFIHGGHYYRVQ